MVEKADRVIIKAFVSKQEAEALDTEGKTKGISRADLCGEVLKRYLSGTLAGPGVPDRGLAKALEESQSARALSEERIYNLERVLSDKEKDLDWTRGQLATTTEALNAALAKIPTAMITDGKTRPSWWDRLMGRG